MFFFTGRLACYICKSAVAGTGVELKNHFLYIHGLRNLKENPVICFQDGCTKEFFSFTRLISHINSHHQFDESFQENIACFDSSEEVSEEITHEVPVELKEEPIPVFLKNMKDLVMSVKADPRNTVAHFKDIVKACNQTFEATVKCLKEQLRIGLENNQSFEEIEKTLEITSPFITSVKELVKDFKTLYNLNESKDIVLGRRVDNTYDGVNLKKKIVAESLQYISVQETLKTIFSNPKARNLIAKEKQSKDNIIRNFKDGIAYKNSNYFKKYPDSIRITFYYDDIEVVNPLGSKTCIHKIGAFYFTIQNFPPELNSKLENIFIVSLCYTEDIKKYGMNNVLKPFFDEMKALESDSGILAVDCNGDEYILRAILTSVSADTLAAHDLFGLMGPGSDYFCRQCLLYRKDLHNNNRNDFDLRTRDQHKILLSKIIENPKGKNFGVKSHTILNDFRYFHFTECWTFDIMHDLFEGIIPLVLKLVLAHYVCESKVLSLNILNTRISSFNYGNIESKNKPSSNFSHQLLNGDAKLKQKACQNWLLLRAMPFILYDKTNEENEKYFDLLIILGQLVSIVGLYEFSEGILCRLQQLIYQFKDLFRHLFPQRHEINKQHHLEHYVEAIRQVGPLIIYWCMRFEGKHNDLKKQARVCNNFINVIKTLAMRHQFTQCYKMKSWVEYDDNDLKVSVPKNNGEIKTIDVKGTEYRLGMILCYGICDEEPQFGIILKIHIVPENVVFTLKLLKNEGFHEYLNAFEVSESKECYLKNIFYTDLWHYRPLNKWQVFGSKSTFVCPKFYILP